MAVVGIDLGTTNSVVATMEDRRVEVLSNEQGKQSTPSVVFFRTKNLDEALVGEPAVFSYGTNPDRGVRFIKKQMGTDYVFKIEDQQYTPEMISSAILKKLVADANQFLSGDEKVTDAIITVPAWFGPQERAATEKAATSAGLTVRALLPEPIAAAIDFGEKKRELLLDKTIMVYDLGGGTFDVCVMAVTREGGEGSPLVFRILGKDGSVELGGYNWDERLAEHVCKRFAEDNDGKNPEDDPASFDRLMLQCQGAKEILTLKEPDESVDVPCNHEGIAYTVSVTRREFEEMTNSLLNETIDKTGELVQSLFGAEGGWDKIDLILLAGGSTKMPAVVGRLNDVSGMTPVTNRGVDFNVGRGAAILAFSPDAWTDKTGLDDVPAPEPDSPETDQPRRSLRDSLEEHRAETRIALPRDTVTHSIGIAAVDLETNQDINHILLKQNSEVGEGVTEVYGLYEDKQTSVDIIINKGESSDLNAVEELGHVRILGLPADTSKGDQVRVTLRVNQNGLITGEAIYVPTQKKVDIEVDMSPKKTHPEEDPERS